MFEYLKEHPNSPTFISLCLHAKLGSKLMSVEYANQPNDLISNTMMDCKCNSDKGVCLPQALASELPLSFVFLSFVYQHDNETIIDYYYHTKRVYDNNTFHL